MLEATKSEQIGGNYSQLRVDFHQLFIWFVFNVFPILRERKSFLGFFLIYFTSKCDNQNIEKAHYKNIVVLNQKKMFKGCKREKNESNITFIKIQLKPRAA